MLDCAVESAAPLPKALAIAVRAELHVLRPDEGHICRVPAGTTIQEIVGAEAGVDVHVYIGAAEIPRSMWPYTRPKHELLIRVLPMQGNGGKVARTVLTVAVLIAAAYTGQWEFAATNSAGWAAAASAGVAIAGNALVDALVPLQQPTPPAQTNSNDRLNSITGQSNQLNPYGVPPVPFGTFQYFPPLGAVPFTEVHGSQQYIRVLLNLGYGDFDTIAATDIMIGESTLDTYEDVDWQTGNISTLPLFANDIDEVSIAAAINDHVDTGNADQVTRTTGVGADEISIDILFQNGLFGLDSTGNLVTIDAGIIVEFSPTGAGTWTNIADVSAFPTGYSLSSGVVAPFDDSAFTGQWEFQFTANTRTALRVGIRWKVPTPGQYDVRLSRIHGPPYSYTGAANFVADAQWYVLRTIRYTRPCQIPNCTGLAMRFAATDRVNGQVSQIAFQGRCKYPVYDAVHGTWSTIVTSNPAWEYLWLLRGAGGANNRGRTLAECDLDAMVQWAADCDAAGYAYNMVVDSQITVDQQLQDIAAAGRASPSRSGGLYSIVQDKDATVPVQLLSPRNSSGFQCIQSFAQPPHALRVQFINPEAGWVQDERLVLADGYQSGGKDAHGASAPTLPPATYIVPFQASGCTDPTLAWKQGRYHLAVQWLRTRTYQCNTDVENLRCTRGSLVRLSNDVIAQGLGWGRIKSFETSGSPPLATSITLDTTLTIEASITYAVRARQQDGAQVLSDLTNSPGDTATLALATPMAVWNDIGPVSGIAVGDLVAFGISGQESVEAFVTRIPYAGDLAAQLVCVDRAPDVYTWDSGTIPTFISGITGLPWCAKPPPPDLSVSLSNGGGSIPGKKVIGGTTEPVAPGGSDNGGNWSGPFLGFLVNIVVIKD